MKRFFTVAIVIVLAAGGVYLYQRYQTDQAAKATSFQTAAIRRGSLTATVGATGTVHANQMTQIAWQTTGTISSVKVQVGQQVKAGDVLAELDKKSLPQNVILAEADLVDARRALDNLLNSGTASAQAQLALTDAQKAYDDAERARGNLNYNRVSQESIDVVKADLLLAQKKVDQMQEIFDQYSGRPEDDTERARALSNLSAAKQDRDKIQRNYNWMVGSSSNQEITEADAKLALARAQLEDAQREWDRLKDGPDAADITAAQARITALEASLNLASLTAPFDGTITEVDVMPGDQVSPASVAFRLDDLSRLFVDVSMSEVDINRISAGQDVTLTFDAIDNKEYHGKVTRVASVGTTVQGTQAGEGVVNFLVTVEVTDSDEAIRPGMTAAVNIVVASIENAIIVPNRAVRLKDGQHVIYLLENGQPTQTEVQLGASSDTDSEVLSENIREGDQVILNPPTDFQSGGRPGFMGGG